MAENILKLELTHHNLISEPVLHFSCKGRGREKGHRAVCRSASLKCVNLMQKFQVRKLIQMIHFQFESSFFSNAVKCDSGYQISMDDYGKSDSQYRYYHMSIINTISLYFFNITVIAPLIADTPTVNLKF